MPGKWLRMALEDGSIVDGWPRFYSEDHEKTELFLEDVTCYRPNGEVETFLGLLLTPEAKIKVIEFREGQSEEGVEDAGNGRNETAICAGEAGPDGTETTHGSAATST